MWMAEGRGEDLWSYRSVVMAELYNQTRSTADRGGQPFEASEFNPYLDPESRNAPPPVDGYLDADDLALIFHGRTQR